MLWVGPNMALKCPNKWWGDDTRVERKESRKLTSYGRPLLPAVSWRKRGKEEERKREKNKISLESVTDRKKDV